MASFNVTVPHQLGQSTARERVERFVDDMRRDHAHELSDVEGQWIGNQLQFAFRVMGQAISGTMAVEENAVEVGGSLPLLASMFRGRIEESIREELGRLLT